MNPVSNDRYRRIRGGAGLLQANDTNASKPAAASQSRSATAQEINNNILSLLCGFFGKEEHPSTKKNNEIVSSSDNTLLHIHLLFISPFPLRIYFFLLSLLH